MIVSETRFNALGDPVESKMHSTDGGQTFAYAVERERNEARCGRHGGRATDGVLYRQLSVLQIAGLGGGSSTNEELYNGKELTDAHRLNGYHNGARYDDVAIAR